MAENDGEDWDPQVQSEVYGEYSVSNADAAYRGLLMQDSMAIRKDRDAQFQGEVRERDGNLMTDAISSEFMFGYGRAAVDAYYGTNRHEGFEKDEEFSFEKLRDNEEDFQYFFKDVDSVLIPEYDGAVSREHMESIRQNIVNIMGTEQRLNDAGWTGIGARALATVIDVPAMAAMIGSEGMALSIVAAQKAPRWAKIAQLAPVGATSVSAVELGIAQGNAYRTNLDLAVAGAAGLIIGGAFGTVLIPSAKRIAKKKHMEALAKDEVERAAKAATLETEGGGSVGAAMSFRIDELIGDPIEAAEKQAAQWAAERVAGRNVAKFFAVGAEIGAKWFPSYSGWARVAGSAHDGVSMMARVIGLSPSGSGRLQTATMSEHKDLAVKVLRVEREQGLYQPTRSWMKEQGYNSLQIRYAAYEGRQKFMSEVADVRRSGKPSKNKWVNQAAEVETRYYNNWNDLMKKHGVEGAADIAEDAAYIPRIWSRQKIAQAQKKFGITGVLSAVTTSIAKASKGRLSEDQAYAVAETILTSVNTGTAKNSSQVAVTKEAREALRQRLNQLADRRNAAGAEDFTQASLNTKPKDFTDSEINDILQEISPGNGSGPSRLKRRTAMDEMHEQALPTAASGGAKSETFRVRDMWEDDMDSIAASYADTAGGSVALARAGFTKQSDVENVFNVFERTKTRYVDEDGSLDAIDNDISILRTQFDDIMGRSVNPDGGSFNSVASQTFLRRMRDFNFIRVMGQSGFASIPELGKVMAESTISAWMKQVPAFGNLFKRLEDGTMDNGLVAEMEAMFGNGSDALLRNDLGRHQAAADSAFVDGAAPTSIDRLLKQGVNVIADVSGLAPITAALERMAASAMIQNFATSAGKGAHKINGARLRILGLTEDNLASIQQQIRIHAKDTKGEFSGNRIATLNIKDWPEDIAELFVLAVRRHTRSTVQRNDFTDLAPFMTTDAGKTIGQFKSFIMVSYEKQLQRGFNQFDAETANGWILATFLSAGKYNLQTTLNAPWEAKARRKYLKERLTLERTATEAFAGAGWFSMMPSVVDGLSTLTGNDPIFDHYSRFGGTSRVFDFAVDNPVASNIQDLAGLGIKATSTLAGNDTFESKDWNKLMKNTLPARVIIIGQGIDALAPKD